MAVISKLPRGATEKEEPSVMATIYGAALEKITSDGAEICTTDANGEGVAVLNVGQMYTLIGGVSGYEKTVKIASDTESIKVMPEGALYWYGNEIVPFKLCSDSLSEGKAISFSSNITGTRSTNYVNLPYDNKYSQSFITENKISLDGYSSIKHFYDCTYSANDKHAGQILASSSNTVVSRVGVLGESYNGVNNNILMSADVSSITTENYILARGYITALKTKAIWLE